MSRPGVEPRTLPGGKLEKDPQRRARAEAIKAVTDAEWSQRPGGKLEKPGRVEGHKLVIASAPEYITNADGEIVGVDAWVQLFDSRGRELPIDPHRRIINPPTVPRAGVRVVGEGDNAIRELTPDPLAAFWEAVGDSVEHTPNEKGWRTRGTVTTVFGDTADGRVDSSSASYATARTGGSLVTDTTGTLLVGQVVTGTPTYFCSESFVSFDTSAITDTDVVSSVVLDVWLVGDETTGGDEFIVEARDFDWGASLTTADWVSGASLGSSTLEASIDTTSIGATGSYKTLTSEAAFLTVTNIKTGTVHIMVSSSDHRIGNAPSAINQRVTFQSADIGGTTQDPKLTITHAAVGSFPPFYSRPNRIWRIG